MSIDPRGMVWRYAADLALIALLVVLAAACFAFSVPLEGG